MKTESGTPADRPVILVVDDTPDNLALMAELLGDRYAVKLAKSGEKALQIAAGDVAPDLILLDIMMPGLSGHDVMRRLKADDKTRNIPVIFLTAMSAEEDEKRGLEMGAVDYITKPVSPPIVLARVANHLRLKAMADFLRDKSVFLEREIDRRTRENRAIQDVTIFALASLAETRDMETGYHIRRTQDYLGVLAERLKNHPRFGWYLTDANIAELHRSAPLHDIGKVGIPDRILLKPAPLTPQEYELMKLHTTLGGDCIDAAEKQLGMPVDFLKTAKEIAYSHQERWDGTGYPAGAKGDEIPVSARLMAVADVYDALISKRVYKEAMTHEEAANIIRGGRGTQFDPDVVDAFLATQDKFMQVAARFADPGAPLRAEAKDAGNPSGSGVGAP